MSTKGLFSVRLSPSFLAAFRAAGQQQGLSVHEAARQLAERLDGLSGDEVRALADPPREPGRVRLSLYLGARGLDLLNAASQRSGLSPSRVLRRVLYAMSLKRIRTVQTNQQGEKQSSPWTLLLIFAAAFVLPFLASAPLIPGGVNSASRHQRRHS